jgi:hypothetical protein
MRLAETPWFVWRRCVVRGAGFPVRLIGAWADEAAAEAADREHANGPLSERYRRAYVEAYERGSAALVRIAADPRFREAVCWQSPHLLDVSVDKVAAEPPVPGRVPGKEHRRRQLLVARYVQRYTVKNESIGFFGPVGWARLTRDCSAISMRPGAGLLARRRVYFESWTIDAVARALARDPVVRRWLRPRIAPQYLLEGDELRTPLGATVRLTPAELAVLRRCDGTRTVAELVGDGRNGAVADAFAASCKRGLIDLGIGVPMAANPEELLRRHLRDIPDRTARARGLAVMDELDAARSAVALAAGRPDELRAALRRLGEVFTRLTGEPPTRRAGGQYAGRTLVYEDTVRAVSIVLGRPVVDRLAESLDLLLCAVRWLAGAVAREYTARFAELFDRACARGGRDSVPLAALLAAATPDFLGAGGEPPPPVARVVADFQRRWQRVLALPADTRRHAVTSAAVRAAVVREFPPDPPRWSSAVHHSPDLMLAAAGPEAIERGDFLAVLGELHVATNTMESRVFLEQAEDPGWLLRADERDHAGRRVVVVPSKESGQVNSRCYPSALLSADHRYWTPYPDTAVHRPDLIPAAALSVIRRDGRLLVQCATDSTEFDLIEAFGEPLSEAIVNGFRMLPPAPHQPRVTIDRLVVVRETWQFPVAALGWAAVKEAAGRYLRAWHWRRAHALPVRCFYRVSGEAKPMYVDFTSVMLVELLGHAIRSGRSRGADATVVFIEMLPDLGDTWLEDAHGERYTAELRMVAVDPLVVSKPDAGCPDAGAMEGPDAGRQPVPHPE